MQRLPKVDPKTATAEQKALLDAVKAKMGKVPNILGIMANSPAGLKVFLSIKEALGGGTITPELGEKIALAIGEKNECHYCVAAHTMIAQNVVGMSAEAALASRRGESDCPKEKAAIQFALKIVETVGFVSDEDVAAVREAGFTDAEIVEIVANVALNYYTNIFNHVADTDIDFPKAPELD